jgi:uncharacterized protein YbbC (DUF1343 family)
MKKAVIIWTILILLFSQHLICGKDAMDTTAVKTPIVKPGIDVLLKKRLDLIKGKRVGLITNQTGITSNFKSTIDALNELPDVDLVTLFGAEHGVRGDIEGGKTIHHYRDKRTGIMVYSVYGETRRPTPEMLKNIDVLLYDIQNFGLRAYTYISSMAYAMEAARDANIPFIVLDRPNPLGGIRVEGNVLDPDFRSFIGIYQIPYAYGMTVGELAKLFNDHFKINCNLTVVPMEGWKRSMTYEDTGLLWIPISPHIPHAETVFHIATIGGIGELGTVSEGVGTPTPFELIGAPWIDGELLAKELNSKNLPGVYFRPTYFNPYYHPHSPQFVGKQCSGVHIHILDKNEFKPIVTQVHVLTVIQKLYPDQRIFNSKRINMFDKAFGTDEIRKAILRGDSAEKIIASWNDQLEEFNKIREKYLIY